jgi:glycosyltransferase involved in cell wall biosynthesis
VHTDRPGPWVVLSQTDQRRWGGDLRRHHVMRQLAIRTAAAAVPGLDRPAVRDSTRRAAGRPWPWRTRPLLASSELLTPGAVVLARRMTRPVAVDLDEYRAAQTARIAANLELFPWVVVPSASFADLVRLDPARVIVAPNGSETDHVRPGPVHDPPAIGFASGAAPGRGIEALVAAARLVHADVPDLRLYLWLAGVDGPSEAYVEGLRQACAADPWIVIGGVPYAELSEALARAHVLVVPHPANAYLDVAVPIKLIDSMAAGRPVVVTPRVETRRIVEAAQAGLVTADDSPRAIAAAVLMLLRDAGLAARLGRNGRAAAERDYDWRVIGDRVADAVLQRAGEGAR